MVKMFDGFIAAFATETKIPFHRENDGTYTANILFEGGRHQKVVIYLDKDESGDGIVRYYSIICPIEDNKKFFSLFRDSLILNTNLDYGAIGIMNDDLVICQAVMLHHLEPERFMKSLVYVAAKADELEEDLLQSDDH